ncbi:pyridoxamine 5'-phosphate oxidase family protein [Haloechinothrix sp. YIM 98757]|uniref:Pyridoxamine 5'-phosphate oxidase family protein n=1 Tax=Haloechinothrix aidingensis TaxID=2752311 RepID=A0A838AEU4_9PSEU|nr:pyridoxamine 5'-phosphate oxidase family protein [Haloechinothrix aidingensis]MBA0127648.1 pyridoxamine 5'-phosphate oxidase family protein [Haloechinothrix aidingensis]
MATWAEIEREVPEFASRVRQRFDSGTHKTMATVRPDGSPRISAIEAAFADGELTLGMMPGSVKLRDVRHDPRIALHCPTVDAPDEEKPGEWAGDAKLAGVLIENDETAGAEPSEGTGFAIDIHELVLIYVGGDPADHLVIESWHAGTGWRRRTRT